MLGRSHYSAGVHPHLPPLPLAKLTAAARTKAVHRLGLRSEGRRAGLRGSLELRSCTLGVQRTKESLAWTLIKARRVFLRPVVLSKAITVLRALVSGLRGRVLTPSGPSLGCSLSASPYIPFLWAASQAGSVPGCLFFTSPRTLIRSFQARRASRGARGHRATLKCQPCSCHHHQEGKMVLEGWMGK